MASATHREYLTFVKGIITETNPLTNVENASRDEANFELKRDGSRRRRLGLDYEAGYILSSGISEDVFSEESMSTYTWNSINGLSSANIVVVQTGETLYLYDSDNASISANILVETIDLSQYEVSGLRAKYEEVQMAEVSGRLVVCSPNIDPFFIYYDKTDNSFFSSKFSLQIRDFKGLESGVLIDENPTILSNEHSYNLKNQGWNTGKINTYFTDTGAYPSDAQQWILGKDSSDDFNSALLDKQDFGNSPAPKGRFVQDVFNRVYNTVLGEVSSTDILTATYYDKVGDVNAHIDITSAVAHGFSTGDLIQINELLLEGYLDPIGWLPLIYITQRVRVTVTGSTSFTFDYYTPGGESLLRLSGGTFNSYSVASTEISEFSEKYRVSSVASSGGRVFYAGLQDSNFSNHIFFSRIIETEQDLGRCYQAADPTSETASDLLDADGGYLVITGMAKVIKLVALENSIVVFATNGVWQIQGGESLGFTALDYSIHKVSSIGTINADSILIVESDIIYWADGGIYSISPEQISGRLNATNISENTIQTLYLEIPSVSRLNATGTYDKDTKRISWLYNEDDTYDGNSYKYKFNKELVFDVSLGAFYKNEFAELDTNSPYVAGYVSTSNLVTTSVAYDIVVNGDPVEVNADQVQISLDLLGRGSLGIKYLTVVPQTGGLTSKMTFSQYSDLDFMDWSTADGTGKSYLSYLDTGNELLGDTSRDKQARYITMHFNRTETGFTNGAGLNAIRPSSCLVQAKWGLSNSSTSGKYGTQFQAYRLKRNYIPTGVGDTFDYGFEVVTTKNKLRGSGAALALRLESEEGKDMHVLGWAVDYVGRPFT
jgi:hypothetical protein